MRSSLRAARPTASLSQALPLPPPPPAGQQPEDVEHWVAAMYGENGGASGGGGGGGVAAMGGPASGTSPMARLRALTRAYLGALPLGGGGG